MFLKYNIYEIYMTDFDLNLTRIFVLLYETRSVTATADVIHVSQPTVSYGLGKLRRRFDDELFRRSRAGLVPTTLADRLYEPLQQALLTIDAAVSPSVSFEPHTASARFTIGLSDLGESSLLPRLVEPLQRVAPHVSLTVVPLDLDGAPEQLGRGELDAFIATPVLRSPLVRRIPLFAESYLLMVSADHPRLQGDSATVDQLRAERHVVVDGPSGHVGPRLALETLDLLDRVALQVTRFSVVPYLVQQSDLVSIVPDYVGHSYAASHPLHLMRLPITLETLDVALYARPERSRGPAQQWLVDFMQHHLSRPVDLED